MNIYRSLFESLTDEPADTGLRTVTV